MKESAALALASDADLGATFPYVANVFRQITLVEALLLYATYGE